MARANRHHLPGYVWHITHRCHKREFLLKFNKDKKQWLNWLFEAKKRYGLCILNYVITSNHIHLLVYNDKTNIIPKAVQLLAGRTGRQYNLRKSRKGAFWEDRYHATAVATGNHLIRCMVYIDLNMVRAGVVHHPSEWEYGGYNELQHPKQRYSLIDRQKLSSLIGLQNQDRVSETHRNWVEESLKKSINKRDGKWTESIAVGDKDFVLETKAKLGAKAVGRKTLVTNEGYELRETQSAYNAVFTPEKHALSDKNSYFWGVLS